MTEQITWQDFEKVELRVGTIIEVNDFPEAKKPAYKLVIDFGQFGRKVSSAQITKLYTKKEFLDKQDKHITERIRKGLEKLKTDNPFHFIEHFEDKDY